MTTKTPRTVLAATVTALALLLPILPGTAHAADEVCTTTSTLKTSRVLPGNRQIKMTYCSNGYNVRVRLHGKGISGFVRVFDSVKTEFRLRDAKGKTVFKSVYDLDKPNNQFQAVAGMQYWVGVDMVSFTLEQIPAGTYRLEGRLLVDWEGDNKGVRRTGYKKVTFAL
jgi:hypothetical protein